MAKPPPVVAFIGSTGFMGKNVIKPFISALSEGRIAELRVLTCESKAESDEIKRYVSDGAKIAVVSNYENASELANALAGVHVLVSTLGTNSDNIEDIKKALLEAMVQAGIKVYFPSEFGTNHYKVVEKNPEFDHKIFRGKREHFQEAKAKGLRPIRMLTGHMMEATFGDWFGLDCQSGIWRVVGDGANFPCALTSTEDVGKFTLEAVILAHNDPNGCPDEMEVYSDMKTLKDYAKAFGNASGREIKINKVPVDVFMEEYKSKGQQLTDLLMILFSNGSYDHSQANGNQLLNPNETRWMLYRVEDFANKTGGLPS